MYKENYTQSEKNILGLTLIRNTRIFSKIKHLKKTRTFHFRHVELSLTPRIKSTHSAHKKPKFDSKQKKLKPFECTKPQINQFRKREPITESISHLT